MKSTLRLILLRFSHCTLFGMVVLSFMAMAEQDMLLLDDRSSGDGRPLNGAHWRLITDDVMGGLSKGKLTLDNIDGKSCLRMQGEVRLEQNGGFVQMALDVANNGALNASNYSGVLLEVYGNAERYNLHLRTSGMWLPWQSYRAAFDAPAEWHTVRLPFAEFEPYRIGKTLNTNRLRRIGVVAIGRAFAADLCLARLALYP